MYKIRKEFHFSASHYLEGLPESHPCSNTHGHNYVVTVELKSKKLNDVGMVVDYRELKPIKEWIDNNLDHKNLNDVIAFNPTAENLANYLYHQFKHTLQFKQICAVEVQETPKTSARYEGA